jgi:DNA-binding XRE family transcriptional regulator
MGAKPKAKRDARRASSGTFIGTAKKDAYVASGRVTERTSRGRQAAPKRTAKAAPRAQDYIKRLEREHDVINRPFDPLPLPPVVGRGEYAGEAVVTVRQEDWEAFLDLVEDIRALQRFDEVRDEPPEAFIPYAEVKKRMWGNHIKDVRRAKGLTQKELAERLDCRQSYVSKIEHPDYRPWASTLERVAEALGVDVTELI